MCLQLIVIPLLALAAVVAIAVWSLVVSLVVCSSSFVAAHILCTLLFLNYNSLKYECFLFCCCVCVCVYAKAFIILWHSTADAGLWAYCEHVGPFGAFCTAFLWLHRKDYVFSACESVTKNLPMRKAPPISKSITGSSN